MAGLNRALSEPALADGVPIPQVALSREALALSRKSAGDRTTGEVERLNRLVLEAVFPGTIRQLNGDGWRPLLVLYGASGLVVAAFYWIVVRDSPAQHPRCNAAELRLIKKGIDGPVRTAVDPPAALPWRLLLYNRNLGRLMSFSSSVLIWAGRLSSPSCPTTWSRHSRCRSKSVGRWPASRSWSAAWVCWPGAG